MSKLPTSWTSCTLRDVSHITTGMTPPTSDRANYGDVTPFVKPGDLDQEAPIYHTAQALSAIGARRARIVRAGAVLVSCIGNLGKIGFAGKPLVTNQQINAVEFIPELVDDRYGYLYCKTLKAWMEREASATTVTILNKSRFAAAPFVLPPLEEQRRIARKVDSVLADLQACGRRLGRVPQILKKFREAVLEAAVSGRLTAEWRATQAAPVAARAYPNAERPDGAEELPLSWNWHAIGDLSLRVSDGVHKRPEYVSTGVPFITVKDLTAGPGIDFSNTRFVSQADHDEFIRRTHPEKGDLLVSKDGTLGVIRLIETDRPFSIFVSVALIKLKDKSLAQYMRVALEAPLVQKQMVGVGSGLQHIHLQDLRKDVIPLPPGHEQREIVRRVNHLFALADDLSLRYENVRAQTESITPSVLAKAFRGELLPQDPNDEPAEDMLERIRQVSGSADVVTKSQVKSVGARSKRQASQGGRRSRASSA